MSKDSQPVPRSLDLEVKDAQVICDTVWEEFERQSVTTNCDFQRKSSFSAEHVERGIVPTASAR